MEKRFCLWVRRPNTVKTVVFQNWLWIQHNPNQNLDFLYMYMHRILQATSKIYTEKQTRRIAILKKNCKIGELTISDFQASLGSWYVARMLWSWSWTFDVVMVTEATILQTKGQRSWAVKLSPHKQELLVNLHDPWTLPKAVTFIILFCPKSLTHSFIH